jgi:hypothetical protein
MLEGDVPGNKFALKRCLLTWKYSPLIYYVLTRTLEDTKTSLFRSLE